MMFMIFFLIGQIFEYEDKGIMNYKYIFFNI